MGNDAIAPVRPNPVRTTPNQQTAPVKKVAPPPCDPNLEAYAISFITQINRKIDAVQAKKIWDVIWLNCTTLKDSRTGENYNVDPLLILAIIAKESHFNQYCNQDNNSKCKGIMQLSPITAKALGVKDRYDLNESIRGGITYLCDSRHCRLGKRGVYGLAGYNAGPGSAWDAINLDKPYHGETKQYVYCIYHIYGSLKANVKTGKVAGAIYHAGHNPGTQDLKDFIAALRPGGTGIAFQPIVKSRNA